jgi:hypothetical protein
MTMGIEGQFSKKDIGEDWKKMETKCICPKCGKHHKLSIHWIGRGIPRKFCNSCRDSSFD